MTEAQRNLLPGDLPTTNVASYDSKLLLWMNNNVLPAVCVRACVSVRDCPVLLCVCVWVRVFGKTPLASSSKVILWPRLLNEGWRLRADLTSVHYPSYSTKLLTALLFAFTAKRDNEPKGSVAEFADARREQTARMKSDWQNRQQRWLCFCCNLLP